MKKHRLNKERFFDFIAACALLIAGVAGAVWMFTHMIW